MQRRMKAENCEEGRMGKGVTVAAKQRLRVGKAGSSVSAVT